MKNKYLFLLFLIFTTLIYSEENLKSNYGDKGVVELTGVISGSYTEGYSPNQAHFDIFPSLNYFFSDGWYLGPSIGLNYQLNYFDKYSWFFATGIGLGKTFQLDEKLFLFAEINNFLYYRFYNSNKYIASADPTWQGDFRLGLKYNLDSGLISFSIKASPSLIHTPVMLFFGTSYSVYFIW